MHNVPGGLVASVRPGRIPGEHKVGLSFRSGADLHTTAPTSPPRRRWSPSGSPASGWQVPRLVEAMHAADDFVLDSMAQVHLPSWSRGRVVLLGDAAWLPDPAQRPRHQPGARRRLRPGRR